MKVLFFSLHAAIRSHSVPENSLVRELTQRGCETVYVSCGKTFPVHCASYGSMAPDAPRAAKDKICRTCVSTANLLVDASGARHLVLKDYLTIEDEARIDALIADVTRDNYLDFQYEGVDVGRAATYEQFLLFKKMSVNLSDTEWEFYRLYLRNSLQSLIGFSHIFEREKPDIVFCYSPQYSVNGVCAQYSGQQGSRVYFIEGSSNNAERYQAVRVWEWGKHGLVNPALHHWETVRDKLTPEDVHRVTGHFEELLTALSFAVYSAPTMQNFSLRQHFGIPDGNKVLLATLSSFDEAFAAYVIRKFPARKVQSPIFRDQFEWIQDTIAYVSGRSDVTLIVRVHPRDYPNKRDPRQSEQAALWENMFESKPDNVIINWPQDGISLYNILPEVDAVVTGWSATGTEGLVFGVPVVSYDRYLPSYPADIHLTGESVAEYHDNIEKALSRGHGFDLVIAAYRWLAVSFSMGTVRVTPPSLPIGTTWPRKFLFRALRKTLNLAFGPMMDRRNSRAGFTSRQDADRFYEMVKNKDASLYDVIERAPLPHQDDAVVEAIRTEHNRLFTPAEYHP